MTNPVPDRINPGKSVEPTEKPIVPQTPTGFDSYMEGTAGKQTPPGTPPAVGGPTPMDLARPPAISTAGISYDSILAQAKVAKDTLGTVEKQLNDQSLKLKRSQSHLIKQKLDDANSHLRAAGSKLGTSIPEDKMPPGTGGISRFLAMVNSGQDKLEEVQRQLQQLAASGQQMNPADLMAIQIKMGLASQEIEYTSTLLGKVIQSTTQIINTQL